MRVGKKQRGMKAEIRAYKERMRRIVLVITTVVLVVIVAGSGFLIYSYLNRARARKAAIIDHLSLTAPNPTFNRTVTNILQRANYTVDSYSGEEVTVNFYRNLPTHGYDIIILRVHSALKDYTKMSPVLLFTSDRFSKLDYLLQPPGVEVVAYSPEDAEKEILYYGITPSFVQNTMNGIFGKTIIVMMGCDGLRYETMAEAFCKKGAKVYISWSGGVLASHTDLATTKLLEHLITEKQTIHLAVTETMDEVGPDPAENSRLLYYPTEAGNLTSSN